MPILKSETQYHVTVPTKMFKLLFGIIITRNRKLLKRHSKAKRRAPAYSRALRQIRGVFQRRVRGRLRSGCQRVKGGRLGGCSLGDEREEIESGESGKES